jgi:FAD/FMN-containing dehydrogenase
VAVAAFEGEIYWPGDDGYEAARLEAVWNELKPQRRPAAIVLAQSEADVVAAVRLARERGLRVKARSGGHSWTGSSVRDGAILVNLSALSDVVVDAAGASATVGPGAKGRDLNAMLAPHGLFFPTGHCPTVGVGGYLLQGGWGWNSTSLGPACLSVTGVDVVTAEGELVHADESHNSELLWAARGAGPGFCGIVTRFHLRCHPRPASMMLSNYVYPVEVVDELLTWALEIGREVPPQLEFVILGTTPRIDNVVVEGPPALVINACAMFDSAAEAERALRLIETCPVLDRAIASRPRVPTTLDELYAIGEATEAPGFRWAVDNMWTDAGAQELVPAVRELFVGVPTAASHVFWLNWPEQEIHDAALSVIGHTYIAAFTGWTDPAQDDALRFWGRDHMRRLEPLSNGIQLADENLDGRPGSRYLSDPNRERLEAIRARWDPDGIFPSYLAGAG